MCRCMTCSSGQPLKRADRSLGFERAVDSVLTEPITALMMVMTLSLLIYSVAERQLREALQSNDETIPSLFDSPYDYRRLELKAE